VAARRWYSIIMMAGTALGLPLSHKEPHADQPHTHVETAGAQASFFRSALTALSTGARRIFGKGRAATGPYTVAGKGHVTPPSKAR
jgi:hypothetical protein